MDFVTKTFNNQVNLKEWTSSKGGNKEKKPPPKEEEPNFLMMMADTLQETKRKFMQSGGSSRNPNNGKNRSWKFDFKGDHNPEKKQTIKKKNRTWK
eukprot:1021168-Ditylum_brightwellii.AAC.1